MYVLYPIPTGCLWLWLLQTTNHLIKKAQVLALLPSKKSFCNFPNLFIWKSCVISKVAGSKQWDHVQSLSIYQNKRRKSVWKQQAFIFCLFPYAQTLQPERTTVRSSHPFHIHWHSKKENKHWLLKRYLQTVWGLSHWSLNKNHSSPSPKSTAHCKIQLSRD